MPRLPGIPSIEYSWLLLPLFSYMLMPDKLLTTIGSLSKDLTSAIYPEAAIVQTCVK